MLRFFPLRFARVPSVSFTVIPKLESPIGGHIAVDQEIHDVTGMLEVVGPFENRDASGSGLSAN